MPRSATSAELAVLASAAFQVSDRVLIQDDEGTWRDLSSIVGFDWLVGFEVDHDNDQPISQATVQVRREGDEADFAVEHLIPTAGDRLVTSAGDPIALFGLPVRLSLSPLVDSIANRTADGTSFQTIVDVGHAIRIERACTPYGVAPSAGDWKRLFEGEIDIVDLEHEPMIVTARDLGFELVDRWTLAGQTLDYTASPQPIEAVVQTVVNALFTPYGDTPPTVYTPESPLFTITTFAFDIESGMDILDRLLGIIGWDLRYRWDDGTSSYRLTLSDPKRTKAVSDFTIGPDQYLDVDHLRIDRTLVRNRVTVRAGEPIGTFLALSEDGVSIARYGIRPIVATEGSDSPIDTTIECKRMADAMLADLKDPKADQSITMLPFWPVELHDVLRFQPNGVHYDTAQQWAIVRVRHTMQVQDDHVESRTVVDTRGAPAVGAQRWLARNSRAMRYNTALVATGGARGFDAIDGANQLRDQRRQQPVSVASINSVQTSQPLSAHTDGAGVCTITIAAHTVRYGFGSVSYNSGSIGGLTTPNTYFVYADDPAFAGGTVTYIATTAAEDVVASNNRYYVGKINAPPLSGSTVQLGGGGGGQVLH